MKRTLSAVAIAIILMSMGAGAEEIKVAAGGAFIENILKPIHQDFQKKQGINLLFFEKGAKFSTMALESGELGIDAMGAGMTFDDWKNLVKKENINVADIEAYRHAVVGQDQVTVVVNKENTVSKLDKAQLKAIFTGKIANWQEVGGPDLPIIIVWTKFTPGPNELFVKKILDGESPVKELLEVDYMKDAKGTVTVTPEAIAIYPSAAKDPDLKFPEMPVLSRPYILITKGAPSQKVKKLLEFMAETGRNVGK